MGIFERRVNYGYPPELAAENQKRRWAIRILIALSAAGILFVAGNVAAGWMAG